MQDLEWTMGPDVCRDFARATGLEWLETDGLGGWAGSTILGAHTRRYHGLLVAATHPPVGRMVLLSRLDETVTVRDAEDGAEFDLACNRFPGAIHPRGFEHLASFRKGVFPVWDYAFAGVKLRKTVIAVHGEATRLVLYEVLDAPSTVHLALRPFFAGRDYHATAHANGFVHREGRFSGSSLMYRMYDGLPEVFVHVPGAAWQPSPDWWNRFQYDRERERGLDCEEDLFTPGLLTVDLAPGARLGVIVATSDPVSRDAFALAETERLRRAAVLDAFGGSDPFCRALAAAGDSFIVRRGEALRTVIAGYHWFSDWGRDTMISLPGLCLITRRFDAAQGILRAFAQAMSEGMLPNRFPDQGETPEYNTVDASLWYFVAVWKYLQATGDENFVRGELLPVLEDILAWHRRGTRHGIKEDMDGLLASGAPGVQLTWMDARVGDWVVTPRSGKPVEIQALWVNALSILAALRERWGGDGSDPRQRSVAAAARFNDLFWNEAAGFLYDNVQDSGSDASLRPNQLLALSLPFPLVTGARAERILHAVEAKLLTPVGLRTLAPDDPAYRPRCTGSPPERDGAYHQGTVWPWLLGPYLTALVRVRGEEGRRQGRELLAAFAPHLGEAGLGSVSEIFDSDPPHAPRGCIAQAWSVAEILRAAVEDLGPTSPPTPSPAKHPGPAAPDH
ncbi:MAG TPA: amylo-alpha-1,6-glucosidase [Thermoanaerobaculia bacterium]|nr:amylo-alpha-1,6-glucosidase [Thermoanaerobaculia bacterium]